MDAAVTAVTAVSTIAMVPVMPVVSIMPPVPTVVTIGTRVVAVIVRNGRSAWVIVVTSVIISTPIAVATMSGQGG
jgi:hypothetical protein